MHINIYIYSHAQVSIYTYGTHAAAELARVWQWSLSLSPSFTRTCARISFFSRVCVCVCVRERGFRKGLQGEVRNSWRVDGAYTMNGGGGGGHLGKLPFQVALAARAHGLINSRVLIISCLRPACDGRFLVRAVAGIYIDGMSLMVIGADSGASSHEGDGDSKCLLCWGDW